MKKICFSDAISEVINEEMERDENVFIIGEDVGEYGGVWGTSKGVYDKFGDMRAKDTPISEAGIIGLAVGAAITGLRPIAEIMYMDFLTTCMDPIVNQAAKIDMMSGWQVQVPIVIRTQYGQGSREAAQHSQSLESWLVNTPGLKVVVPSNPYDAKGLLLASIRDNTPVVFMENRFLYSMVGEIPETEYQIPLGEANIISEGDDITIVSYGNGISKVQEALKQNSDISAEVIDLRTLIPLDIDTIIESVKKTGRVLVVHEGIKRGGFGAEIVRQITEKGFNYLDAEPMVCSGLNVPIPFSGGLEDMCLVDKEKIIEKIKYLLTGV